MDGKLGKLEEFEYFNSENIPIAANTVEAFRSSGHTNTTAICDICDNSIEANSKNIWIHLREITSKDKFSFEKSFIVIADDGDGMDINEINNALRTGGKRDHEEQALGKFGMGLTTAASSMGKYIKVISLKNNIYSTSIYDVDICQKHNEWCKYVGTANNDDIKLFQYFTRRTSESLSNRKSITSGTIIIITKIDKIFQTASALISELKNVLGETFCSYLDNKVDIYLDNWHVKPIDLLELNNPETELICNYGFGNKNSITINDHDSSGKIVTFPLQVRMSLVPTKDNIAGFTIKRVGRTISSAKQSHWLDIYHQNPNLARVRAEINFTPEADLYFGINYSKNHIDFCTSAKNKLQKILKPHFQYIIHKESERQRDERQKKNQVELQAIMDYFNHSRLGLVSLGIFIKEKRNSTGRNRITNGIKRDSRNIRQPRTSVQDNGHPMVNFSLSKNGVGNDYFESYVDNDGKSLSIILNTDHSYIDYLMDVSDTNVFYDGIVNIFTLGKNMFVADNDSVRESLRTMKKSISDDLRVLEISKRQK